MVGHILRRFHHYYHHLVDWLHFSRPHSCHQHYNLSILRHHMGNNHFQQNLFFILQFNKHCKLRLHHNSSIHQFHKRNNYPQQRSIYFHQHKYKFLLKDFLLIHKNHILQDKRNNHLGFRLKVFQHQSIQHIFHLHYSYHRNQNNQNRCLQLH